MSEPKVELLVLSTCLQCKALKRLLDSHGVPYDAIEVDLMEKQEREDLFRELVKYNEKKAFPVTFINNKAIIGFQKRLILEELGLSS